MANTVNTILSSLRRTPAEHLATDMENASVATLTLCERPFPLQVGLRARLPSSSAEALESVLGFPLPHSHGEVTGDADGLHAMWLSPDEFLAVDVSKEQQPGDVLPFVNALEGLPGHAVDLSANRTVLELSGSCAPDVLAKGCHIDLHPRSFKTGMAVATGLGPVGVYLHRAREEAWRIYPRASFADFTVRWLIDAMQEFTSQ